MNTIEFDKLMHGRATVLEQHGADPYYVRHLYEMFRSLGMKEVGVSTGGYGPWAGGSTCAKIHLANSLQSREEILAIGILTQEEFEAAVRLMKDPDWIVFSHLMISAWGRKS